MKVQKLPSQDLPREGQLQIEQTQAVQRQPQCPRCGSSHIHAAGSSSSGKQLFKCVCCGKKWTKDVYVPYRKAHSLQCPDCHSTYVYKHGTRKGKQKFRCVTCNRYWTEGAEEPPPLIEVNPEQEYKKDVWDIRRLGLKPTPGCSDYTLNFTQISQEWLKQAVKKFIQLTLVNLTHSCARDRVRGVQYFSHFLAKSYPYI